MFKKIFFGIIILAIGAFSIRMMTWLPDPYPHTPLNKQDIPLFKEIGINFAHKFAKDESLPFMGGAVFDMRGDGQQYLFVSGGYNQPDRLYRFSHDSLIDITDQSGIDKAPLDTTYGVAAIDAHGHGLIDLFIARESGVYLYKNTGGKYEGKKLDIPLDPKHAPISIAVADLKKRNKVDLFICSYVKAPYVEGQSIFNREDYGGRSLLLLNNGDNTFKDITKEAGLDIIHNTFQAAFVDLDDDGEIDLVVAYDTGHVGTYKNMGNLKFKSMPNPTSSVYSYPMGIAVGDYNNDSRPDLYFSNIGPFYWWNLGSTPPDFIVRGDLTPDQTLHRSHILLRNDGNFNFTDVADQAKVADYEFGWGAVFADFSNNGLLDLAIAQNYIGFPPHKIFKLPNRLLIQQQDHTFASVGKIAGVENPYYGISPLVVDFTKNGYPDLIYLNLNGPVRIFLNKGTGNNYIKVTLKNEPRSLGAKVVVKMANGKTKTGFFVPTQGLCTYQTNSLFFGLGREKEIESIQVNFLDGKHQRFDHPQANQDLKIP
jgi:hypothetical protein